MISTTNRLPLSINVFWHHANQEMFLYAKLFYNFFKRNIDDPLDRYLGIPINFFPEVPASVEHLKMEESDHVANIILMDDHMIIDNEWKEFIENFALEVNQLNENYQFLPVAISANALKFENRISEYNFIRLFNHKNTSKSAFLLIKITHEICRRLNKSSPISNDDSSTANNPIKLFLSHAKMDVTKFTDGLRQHINSHSDSGLKTFFDTNDIRAGGLFSKEIENNIKRAVIIVTHTDHYSSRAWCRKEVLLAKKYNRPIIVINQFEEGEYRSFPYMGNIPHIHYGEIDNESKVDPTIYDFIILQTLRETLRFQFKQLIAIAQAKVFDFEIKDHQNTILSHPPELVSLVRLKEITNRVIIYPDPPLGQEEMELIKQLRPDLHFITPTLIPLVSKDKKSYQRLQNLQVGISLSEVDQLPFAWIENWAIQDLMVEISKYLLVGGARLVYSGDVNYKGEEEKRNDQGNSKITLPKPPNFTKLLIDLVKTYKSLFSSSIKGKIFPIKNYSNYPYYKFLKPSIKADLINLIDFQEVSPPAYLQLDNLSGQEALDMAKHIIQFDNFEKKYVFAKSLTKMRKAMIKEEAARIVLGGKWTSFKGCMPGVLEEVLIALEETQPLYIIGAFGGVARGIIDALTGDLPKMLTKPFYEEHYPDYHFF